MYAPPGVPGVETMYPLLMYYAKKGFISYERLVEAISVRPAQIQGMADRGIIKEGALADLVIFDLHQETRIKGDGLHYKCGWTPFEGMEAIFPNNPISPTLLQDSLPTVGNAVLLLGLSITRLKSLVFR